MLQPAHRLLWKDGQVTAHNRYWKLDWTPFEGELSEQELADELLKRLGAGVKRRLVSDVPIGFFLSGGVDSSLSTALAAEAAKVHIDAGADVLTGSAQQVVGAIGVAADNKVFWLGTQADQTPLAPDYVVTNQLYDWVGVVKDMIALHNSGTLGGKVYTLTLTDGLEMHLSDNPALTDEIRTAADAAIAGIKDGSIDPMPSE